MRPSDERPSGFGLIELIVAISVIAILVAISLPALARTWGSARDVKSLANIRTHLQVHGLYQGDFDDKYPFLLQPSESEVPIEAYGRTFNVGFFVMSAAWPIPLSESYYGGDLIHESFTSPHRPGRSYISDYRYSHTLFSDPKLWNYLHAPSLELLRPVSGAQVRYPSSKGAITTVFSLLNLPEAPPKPRVGWADGAAEIIDENELLPGYMHGTGGFAFGPTYGKPVMDTRDGALGRDR